MPYMPKLPTTPPSSTERSIMQHTQLLSTIPEHRSKLTITPPSSIERSKMQYKQPLPIKLEEESPQPHKSIDSSILQYRSTDWCKMCKKYMTDSPRTHPSQCCKDIRLSTWRYIINEKFDNNREQFLYINAGDRMRYLLHSLNSLLPNADEALLSAGLVFIEHWRSQERMYRNNDYLNAILKIPVREDAILRAVGEQIISVLSWHGPSLPVILAVEDAFWALSRKLDFTIEENSWLLQWLHFSPRERDACMGQIKEMFLAQFLPMGRPRKSRRVLRKKLCELWKYCKAYEYSQAPWTQELDSNLVRVAGLWESDEERIYGFMVHCYANDLRLRDSDAILRRLGVLGCRRGVLRCEERKTWERARKVESEEDKSRGARSGRPRSLDIFKSSRRRSV